MKNRIILMASLLFSATMVFAQHDEQVTVEGKYRPKVNKVNKLVLQPETPQPSYEFPSTEVTPMETTKKFALDLDKIAPAAYAAKNDKLVTPTENFLMAGIGTRLSPVFLYKHNSMLTKTLGVGVGAKHLSSWLNIRNYAPSGYMNNAFDINLTTSKFDGWQLDGGLYYKNDLYHYYGVNLDSIPLTDDQIEQYCPRQTYHTIGGHVGLASTSTRVGELSHSGDVDYHFTFDNTYAREHFLGLEYGLGYAQNWWGDKSHPQKAGVDLAFQYEYFESSHLDPTMMPIGNRNDLYLFKVNPYFEMSDEFYQLHLGVRLDGVNRIQNKDKFLAIRPDVRGSLFVLNKKLEFYAGLNGGRKLLTYSEFINENPFVGCNFPLLAQNVKLGFEGGVRTNIMEIVDMHVGVRYNIVDNLPYYELEPVDVDGNMIANKYGVGYFENTQVLNVLADARVKLRNSLTADLGFAYNHYNLSADNHAYYRPATEAKLKLTYDFNDDLSFNASLLYQGGRYALIPKAKTQFSGVPGWQFEEEKLKDVFDLSLGADYKVDDQLTAFALLDNVACQKYQLYYNYPVTGIQLFAGVKLKF